MRTPRFGDVTAVLNSICNLLFWRARCDQFAINFVSDTIKINHDELKIVYSICCVSPIFVGSKTDWKQNVIKEYFWSGLVLIVVFNLGRQRLQLLMPQCRRISVLPLQSARDKQRPDQMP